MADFFGYLWSAVFLFGWGYLTVELVRAAFKGRFWFWRKKATGRAWPPVRDEAPIRFWIVWFLLAGPFLLITFIGIGALFSMVLGNST